MACGPGPYQGGTDHEVNFGVGTSQFDWECVELSMRYMYLVYGITPWYLPDGDASNIVTSYSGSVLTKVSNNGTSLPSPGDIIAESASTADPDGHTAVVTAVNVNSSGDGTVTIMEQNVSGDDGGYNTINVVGYSLGSDVSGWLHNPVSTPQAKVGPGIIYIGTDQLTASQVLYPNRYILSSDNRFMLVLQGDGNLVEYGPGYEVMWDSNTECNTTTLPCSNVGKEYATLENTTGDFVLMGGSSGGTVLWSSGAYAGAVTATLQTDGNFVLQNSALTALWSSGTGGNGSGFTSAGSNQLASGGMLYAGQYLQSTDGRFSLVMQTDGNLVLYGPAYQALWSSGTNGLSVAYAILQSSDGNFVLYNSSGTAVWNAGTAGLGAVTATVQSDGGFDLNTSSGASVWSTPTGGQIYNAGSSLSAGGTLQPNYYLLSPNTRFVFIQQSDGNLVLYDYNNDVLWADSEQGHTNAFTTLQSSDGNLVEYTAGGSPYLWSPFVSGGAHLNMQSDGNVVLYNSSWVYDGFQTGTS